MKVWISQNCVFRPDRNEILDTLDTAWYEFLISNFDEKMQLFICPNHHMLARRMLLENEPELIILTGGNDVGVCENRELTEDLLLSHALKTSIPLLGVCRGFQKANIFLGGSSERHGDHVNKNHTVLGCGTQLSVNSFHNNVINSSNLSPELEQLFHHSDGSIEAAKHRSLPWLLVMWHPERAGCCHEAKKWLKKYIMENLL